MSHIRDVCAYLGFGVGEPLVLVHSPRASLALVTLLSLFISVGAGFSLLTLITLITLRTLITLITIPVAPETRVRRRCL